MGARTWKQRTRRAYALCTSRRVLTTLVAVGYALSLTLLGAGQAQAACSLVPTVTDLGNPPPSGVGASATGINSRGQIVGWSWDQTGTLVRPFLWNPTSPNASSGAFTDIAALPDSTKPSAINAYGQVVGTKLDAQTGFFRAVLWTPDAPNATTGGMTELSTLMGFGWSYALAMNDFGQVVGYSLVVGGDDHAFLWTPNQPNGTTGAMVDLGVLRGHDSAANDINNSGVVVGKSELDSGGRFHWHAFRWTPTAPNGTTGAMSDLGVLPDDYSSFATAINNRGDLVGYDDSTGKSAEKNVVHPWMWTGKTLLPFPKMPSEFNVSDYRGVTKPGEFMPNAINEQKMVAGWSFDFYGNVQWPVLWNPTSSSATSGKFINLGGPVNTQAIALNDHGQVVGTGIIYYNPRALLWTLTSDCK
jgi:probable HAF family extracellular repeat protein